MIVTREVWRTADGRLVEYGDADGAFVAYTRGTEIADSRVEALGLAAFVAPTLAHKTAAVPTVIVPAAGTATPVAVELEPTTTAVNKGKLQRNREV